MTIHIVGKEQFIAEAYVNDEQQLKVGFDIGSVTSDMYPNDLIMTADNKFQLLYKEVDGEFVFRSPRKYTKQKNAVWGVVARNVEQNYALNLLMDPNVDFVTLQGFAGTGKTLLSLAAGLAQVLDKNIYTGITITRATIPIAKDIGFLPGTEEEKMIPWMGALMDNLEVLGSDSEIVQKKIKIQSINFMRGRTFFKRYIIVDECQNLAPKQMKTLITRAGEGTKIVCLGDIDQIDTPGMTKESSGFTYIIDKASYCQYHGHVTLTEGERSRLANWAAKCL